MRLEQLPAKDPVVDALLPLLPETSMLAGQGMPLVEMLGAAPEDYLSKNTRKALAKIRNRIKDRGIDVQMHWTTDADEIVALLPELARVHRERDLSLGRRPDHDDLSSAAFYRDVITRHARAGEMEALALRLDGDLAAYVCGFRDGRTLRSWDNRLAPRWADLSAGRIANTEALRHVAQSADYDALDWMRGEEPYKLQSATVVIPTVSLHAWSSRLVRRGDEVSKVAVTGARDRLRKNAAIKRAVQGLRRLRHGRG